MTKFESIALRAVLGQLPPGAQPPDFTDWNRVGDLLNALTPEQRCDAVYAEWLHQLQSSSGWSLLRVRDELISHGALAANYLAELAQNANDASDGQPAEIRIVFVGDWLLVANNGRKITSKNLLGLCRFFVHFGRESVQLNQETIGRFGIGFKSSYRIASEVFVETWDSAERFAFRLPICHPSRPDSHPEPMRRDWIREHLRLAGSDISEETCQIEHLGLCTPEFVDRLPDSIRDKARELQAPKRGTVFCFHLHEAGRKEVASRITGEAGEVYELCPLFLPNLAFVQRGEAQLTRQLNELDAADGIPGAVEARKVTLTTSLPGQSRSNSCFWRLCGLANGDKWQVALHTNSQFRLSVARVVGDEEGTSLRDGAAYAFFPLNDVNSQWPLRLHLHVDLPTILSRGNWNGAANQGADRDTVVDQVQRTIAGLVEWLELHHDKRHADWRLEDLVERVPEKNELWARTVWEALLLGTKTRRVLRTLNGSFVSADEAVSIELLDKEDARRAWAVLLGAHPGRPVVEARRSVSFGVQALNPDEVADQLIGMTDWESAAAALRQSLLQATLGCSRTTIPMLERVLGSISAELASGGTVTVRELFRQPGGAELTPEWHAVFRRVASWAATAPWRHASVFGGALEAQLRKLTEPEFNPTWEEVTRRMADEAAWQQNGGRFWLSERLPCPQGLQNCVLACLRVPVGNQRWRLLSDSWLINDSVPVCLDLLFGPISSESRQPIQGQLCEWNLSSPWVEQAESRIRELLPARLLERLMSLASTDAFLGTFSGQFDERLRQLPGGFSREVSDAAKAASSRFVRARVEEDELKNKTLVTLDVATPLRAALCLLPERKLAPPWLTPVALQRLDAFGLTARLSFRVLSTSDVEEQQRQLIRELLEEYHQWKESDPTPDALAGLEQMAASVSRTNRRNWAVGFSPQKKPLLKELILTQASESDANLAEQLNQLLLAKVDARRNADRLPALLAKIPSLAGACAQSHTLTLKVPVLTLTAIERGQILPAALEEPVVRGLVEAGKHSDFTTAPPLKLVWLQDGEVVATLPAADYVVDGDKLIFAHSLPPAELEPYQNILRAYEDNERGSAEYRHDREAGVSAYERFQKYRPVITKVLVESRVRAFGYQEQHILRELLQNAESAYASKQESGLPAEPWFELAVTRLQGETGYRVTAMHEGRAFDEPDKHGNPRPDVDRIIMESAPAQNTEDEVGRFNRGFKSVFCAARDKRVRVESGGFDFVIQDLMLRFPPKPERNAGAADPVTKFTFESSRQDAVALLGLTEPLGANSPLPLINASSLVFLRYICRVTVRFENRMWTWKTTPGRKEGWQEVSVDPCGGCSPERFLVYHAPRSDGGSRFATALRLGQTGLPKKLEQAWHCLRLTFETDEEFSLDVLVNGQFEAEFGRRKLIKIPESGLVDQSLATVIQRSSQDFAGANVSKERWLAWACVLNLENRMAGLANRAANAKAIANQVEEFLTKRIPHDGTLKAAADLDFPSNLMRRLSRDGFCARWGIDTSNWIDPEIAAELPNTKQDDLRLDDWLRNARLDRPRLQQIQDAIEARQFRPIAEAFSGEITKAKQLLQLRLRPARGFQVENWQAAELFQRWQEDNEKAHGRLLDDYTLEGANWTLLYPSDSTTMAGRKDKLRHDLAHEDTAERSLRVWYRLFGLACLMSARGRTETLRTFWKEKLEASGFWDATCAGRDFDDATRDLFKNLVLREHRDAKASGEWADYWRRVFYDIRKVHELVWQHDFADTVLRLASDPERARELPQFLRSGQLAEQKPWAGVLGQSAGAPLFFVVRELCRLGAIPPSAMESVRPLAFFACTPVRRAAVRIGWLDSSLAARTDFESLAEVSRRLFERISSDTSVDAITRQQLLNLYDIPLLHLGLNG